jgi:colanic acid biosynthesis glycosyl transferase WcaI
MHILIHSINFSPEPIGVGKYTGEMAEWLARRDHDVRVVTTSPHYPQWRIFDGYSSWRFSRERYAPPETPKGMLEVFRCPVWIPSAPRGWKRILHLASFSLSSWVAMLRQIPWRPDVVLLIAPTLFCAPQALCVARLSGATSWLHVQDFEVDVAFQLTDFSSFQLRRWVHALERFFLSKFDRISAISVQMVERLLAKGISPERAVLFPNWVDTSLIYPMPVESPFRKELGIPPEKTVALYSGNMGKKQGLDLLVEVCRRLASRNDIQFLFCGDGSYRDAFVRMIKSCRNMAILPLQPAERLNDLLNAADIHLLPQVSNAADLVMPSKLTGMMASGRPVVATALPGTQLFRAVEGRGIVAPPGDAEAFVAALVRLADEPRLRKQMGEEARNYAISNLDRDEILRQFELSIWQTRGFSSSDPPARTAAAENQNRAEQQIVMTSGKAGDD